MCQYCMPPLSKFYITFTFFAQKPRLLYIYDSRAVLHAASILPSLFSGCQACRQQRRHKTQCLASSYPPARIVYQTPMSVMSNPTEIFKVFPLLKSLFVQSCTLAVNKDIRYEQWKHHISFLEYFQIFFLSCQSKEFE